MHTTCANESSTTAEMADRGAATAKNFLSPKLHPQQFSLLCTDAAILAGFADLSYTLPHESRLLRVYGLSKW